MTHAEPGGHAASHEAGHDAHGGSAKYLAVFGALLVLTVISFALGSSSLMETTPMVGRFGMLAVSVAKALLVMLFFMHLLWEANWKYVLTIPATLMSVFLVVMLTPDIAFRTSHYNVRRWTHASEASPSDHGAAAADARHTAEHGKSSEEANPRESH